MFDDFICFLKQSNFSIFRLHVYVDSSYGLVYLHNDDMGVYVVTKRIMNVSSDCLKVSIKLLVLLSHLLNIAHMSSIP